jgi:hypothetical protein
LAWLRQLGFADNPFALRQAALEADLDEYFVEPPKFEQVLSAHTVLLFAARGGGKTACRITVERACRPYDRQSKILAIPYYKALPELAAQRDCNWPQEGHRHHLEALLRHGLYAMVDDLLSAEEASIDSGRLLLLRGLIDGYAPMLVGPHEVLSRLYEARALRGGLDTARVLAAFQTRRLREALGEALAPENDAGQILVALVDTPSLPVGRDPVAAFVRAAKAFGLESAFILVDGLDELFPDLAKVQDQAALLASLLAMPQLMQHSFFACKCFLPIALQPALAAHPEVRMDWWPPQIISWSDEALLEMLQLRLRTYSDDRVSSLTALFDESGRTTDVDARLVRWASGSPRVLLELGDELVQMHDGSRNAARKLTEAELQVLERRFQDDYAPALVPPLVVEPNTGRVLIGDKQQAQMSGNELALLAFLYGHAGDVKSKDDIWHEVYGYDTEGVSDTAIDSLVYRVRKKIEQDPGNPIYLLTVRGQGYQLLNTEQSGNG